PVVLGAGVYAIARFNPSAALQAVHEQRISIMMAIPTMYAAMLRCKSAPDDALKSIYLAMSGGEPLPVTVAEGFEQRFGVKLLQGYGLTETAPVLSLCAPHAFRDGSVGRLIPGVDCRIVDESSQELPCGADGEIQVKGPGVMKGYHNHPQETAQVIDPDGWFRTGDIGRLDEDGYLYITGRKKEMMIVGGENVAPAEIENVLLQHDAVAQAAVIGTPDSSRGEVPVAFVTLQEGADPDRVNDHALRTFARQRLAGYKVPRRVVITDDLPKGPTGKVLKRKLAELI
ncbi:MAG: class I adenylate-forming enzyme family protein, partial [Phycisphaerae bacterium]